MLLMLLIPHNMKDPLQFLDYDSWRRKDLNNILPYVILAVTEDITQKMEVQFEDSSSRIDYASSNGEVIFSHLQCLKGEQKFEYFSMLMEPTLQSTSKKILNEL